MENDFRFELPPQLWHCDSRTDPGQESIHSVWQWLNDNQMSASMTVEGVGRTSADPFRLILNLHGTPDDAFLFRLRWL